MNKKMKMFIICAVFALMISCKNYASGENLKNSEQN
ncbi:ErpL protein, partial [Borreliella burgdorferi]